MDLKAGDGVAYILPLLHFGSRYSTKTRRTLHGGYSIYADLPGMAPDSAVSRAIIAGIWVAFFQECQQ